MNSKQKTVIAVLLFILIMISAYIAYDTLGKSYIPEAEQYAQTENDPAEKKYDDATDFEVYTFDEKSVRLSDFRGRGAVVNFWATWCPPCKAELPHFEKMYEKYGNDIEFMMVNLTDGHRETVDGAKGFIDANGYTFPVYYDTGMSASYAYRISSVPLTIFVDSNGKIIKRYVGMLTESVLERYIDEIL